MRIAYLDCPSGISGDMTLGALIDAGADLAAINDGIASLGLPGVRVTAAPVKRRGFRATHVTVEHQPEEAHRHLSDIVAMIDASRLTARQRDLAKRIFTRLGEAEAKVHGTAIENVHFHEVGAVDSIADIVGAAIGFDLLGVDRVAASPVPTGTGYIEIAHGRVSVPAPATAELLRGVPIVESRLKFELTTPTGAAILAALAESFGPLPSMTVHKIGYGAGTRNFKVQANVLRLLVGQTEEASAGDQIWIVQTNLDDTSGEVVGYCTQRLWEAGALDVYTTAIQMKKNRPGVTLTALCDAKDLAAVERVLFRETTTLGVRRWPASRSKLARKAHTLQTEFGPIEGKLSQAPGEPPRFSPEYESCRRIAAERGIPLLTVYEAARRAFDPMKIADY